MKIPDPIAVLQLHLPPDGLPSATEIQLAKARLLAELEYAGQNRFTVQGLQVSRSTILWAVRTLTEPRNLEHWVTLHRTPALRAFIQDPKPTAIPSLPRLSQVQDGGFRIFAATLMGRIFKKMVDAAVAQADWEAVKLVQVGIEWAAPWHAKLIFAAMGKHVKAITLDMREYRTLDMAGLDRLWDAYAYPPALLDAVKALPERLRHLCNELATEMIATAKYFAFELGDEARARILIDRVVRLDLSAGLAKDAAAMRKYLFGEQKALLAETESRMTTSDVVMGMVQLTGIFLMLFIMMRRCGA